MAQARTFTGDSPALGPGGGGPVTLVEGSSFCLSGRSGDIRPDLPEGLFFLDTRLLSDWQLRVDGLLPETLAATTEGPGSATFVSRVRPDLTESSGELMIVRRRYVDRGMHEDMTVRNYGPSPVTFVVVLFADVDFADLFDVKLGVGSDHISRTRQAHGSEVEYGHCRGPSCRTVTLSFSEEPTWDADAAVWNGKIEPGGSWSCCAEVIVAVGDRRVSPAYRCGKPPRSAETAIRQRSWKRSVPRLTSDHAPLVRTVERCLDDLGSLRIFDPEHPARPAIAAGAPWFMTLFGRDSILTAWMSLMVDPDIAVGVMDALARLQGEEENPATEEQPGRILHEVRFGEAMSMSLGDGHIYYGTADATPLFVMLLGELARWGHDPDLIARLTPHADRALSWIEEYGDRDGDGYVEYQRLTHDGLRNQGWKDSWDGVPAADGSVPDTPIALCEVQAYVYAAYIARAHLASEAGDDATCARYEAKAAELREAFERDFWLPERGWYALGLDAEKRPIDALASNMGHCLWAGIVDPVRAESVVRHLMSPEMFSGWGVRTLATSMPTFDPLSYHNGSVWPHDNALLAAGMMRYGFVEEAHRVILAMLDVADTAGGRLPELFAGVDRADIPVPVAYPTSCSPQAWAAAAPLMFLRTLLRLEPALYRRSIWCAPRLPQAIRRLRIDNVPLAGARVSIRVDGDDWELDGLDHSIEVVREPRAPQTPHAHGDDAGVSPRGRPSP